jgi:hypothetical protein
MGMAISFYRTDAAIRGAGLVQRVLSINAGFGTFKRTAALLYDLCVHVVA